MGERPLSNAVLRVVLDTNVFMPSTFHHIDESRFRDLCRSGRIVPVYGHVVLEETFRAYGIEAKRIELGQALDAKWL